MIARFLSPCLAWLVLVLAPLEHTQAKLPVDLKKQITAIQAVGAEGSGNAEAAVAFRSLSQARASALLPLLRAIEPSNRIARNWLRSAVEVIVERELAEKKPLPFADLKTFLSYTSSQFLYHEDRRRTGAHPDHRIHFHHPRRFDADTSLYQS